MLARFHFLKQAQAFLHGTIPIGAVFAGLGQGAAVFAHLLGAQLAHIGQTALDPVHGDFVALVIVFAGEEQAALPVEAQPVDVGHDAVHILGLFLGGVGIVKAQIGHAAEFFGGLEIREHGLAMADVQVAVGFGRETGVHVLVTATLQILLYGFPDKIGFVRRGRFHSDRSSFPVLTADSGGKPQKTIVSPIIERKRGFGKEN